MKSNKIFNFNKISLLLFSALTISACNDDKPENQLLVTPIFNDCGDIAHNESDSRTMYLNKIENSPATCSEEKQVSLCTDGVLSDWSGSYTNISCSVENAPVEPIIFENCGDVLHGASDTRTMYLNSVEDNADSCLQEIQTNFCNDGVLSEWTGTYTHTQCLATNELDRTDLVYQGGFRLTTENTGESIHSNLDFAPGVIEYNPKNKSLFVVGNHNEQGIAEMAIPEIINTKVLSEFAVGKTVLQKFTDFQKTDKVETGINGYFLVTGLSLIGNKLIANYINWYDANASEVDTSVVFQDATNIETTAILGPYQIEGAAHASGWLTPIPDSLTEIFGGTHLSGWSGGSINSRLSIGPSAFVQTPANDLLKDEYTPTVETNPVLDFSLKNMLYYKDIYGENYDKVTELPDGVNITTDYILYNIDSNNDLWTVTSKAVYGLIIPDSNTYMTLGSSSGHHSGLGYKIKQDNGHLCGGPCSYAVDDAYNYYWLWRVSDLIKVKKGELLPHEVRPYKHGVFDVPTDAFVSGGAFDYENSRLYLSVKQGDITGTYSRPPLYFVYDIKK